MNFGHLVRLWGIRDSQLPEKTATPEELTPFLTSLLLEACPFIGDVPGAQTSPFKSSWQSKGSRCFRHSKAPVNLYERTVPVGVLQGVAKENEVPHLKGGKMLPETWFLRRSVHEDSPVTGTASWHEWVRCFKERHAEAEKEFTPTVLSTRVNQEWDCRGIEIELEGETWVDWTLKLEESVHKMPTPLKNRVFPVLQATAAAKGKREFMIVQIATERSGEGVQDQSSNVLGAYTSIERLMETPDGVEWIMGTVSDAKGALPPWLQKMAMPGPVAKDVDKFLGWVATQRKSNNGSVQNGHHNGQQNGRSNSQAAQAQLSV